MLVVVLHQPSLIRGPDEMRWYGMVYSITVRWVVQGSVVSPGWLPNGMICVWDEPPRDPWVGCAKIGIVGALLNLSTTALWLVSCAAKMLLSLSTMSSDFVSEGPWNSVFRKA